MKKIIAVFIVLIAFFIFVFYTASGLRLVLATASEFIPGKLKIEKISGRLAKQISIANLSYQKGDIKITAHNINLIWNPFYLLQRRLIIQKLHANDIVIGPIIIDNLNLSLFTTGKQIDFADVKLQGPNILFKIKGQLKNQYDYNWTLHIKKLNDFVPQISGVLTAQGQITGQKNDPKLNAALQVRQLQIQNKIALHVTDIKLPSNINLTVHGNFSKIYYSTHIYSGGGYLEINGETALDKTDLPSAINIAGTDFLVSDTDTIKIKVTPSLKLLLDKQHLAIDGNIIIPWAKIEPHDFSSTETLPNDVVFVTKKQQKAEPTVFAVYTHIKLILGDHIDINAMGLKGKLAGQLEITQKPKITPDVSGELIMYNGTYDLYGQQLTLQKSKAIFTGPMDNPELDIRAVRVFKTVGAIEDLTVGAHITGIFAYPKTILYSEPSGLSQEDILSYLMFGQSSTQLTQDKAGLLMRAAGALHFGGPSTLTMLTDSLQEKFGLTKFGLATEVAGPEADQMTTNTAFVMGKYILPYLYVSYSVGLLDAVNVFRVRYKLWEKWAIQSESSSLGNGIDLLYSIVRD
jgi:translocation and assembly module TamB